MNLSNTDIITLSLYLGGIVAMGFYFSRKNTSTEEYFVGGRSFPGWAIGLSLVGTSISSITFLAYPGDAFKTSWIRFLPNLMLPIAVAIAAYTFLRFFRQEKTTTAYEFLETRFGPSVRLYGAVAFIFAQLVRLSIILYLLSLLVHELTGLDPVLCIVLGGIFVAIYTIIGGIDAVIWTDVAQTIVLVLGGIICLWHIVDQLPGGFQQIFEVANTHGKLAFAELKDTGLTPIPWHFSLLEKTGTMMLILGLVSWLTEYSSNQNTVQRFCASKSDKDAKQGMFIAAFAAVPIWAFYMFLGTALFVFFQQFPTVETNEMLSGERKAEQVLPFFILNQLPAGLVGIVIAAALAAAMSSLDSSINSISTVSIVDIYRRHLNPQQSDKHYLHVAWIVATICAISMILGAIYLQKSETKTLQDTATILASLLGGGLLGIYLLGFFTRVGDARSVWIGIACTICFTSWTLLAKNGLLPNSLHVPFDLYYTSIIGNIVMFFVGFMAATLLPKQAA